MGLPGVIVNQIDGNLGLTNGSPTDTAVMVGTCTGGVVGQLYSIGDVPTLVATLGAGKLVEDGAYLIEVAGGPHYFMPVAPSVAGAFTAPVFVGTGTETLAVSAAPHLPVTVVVTTSGALGTAAATYQVGSGPVSAPVILPVGHTYAVPNTFCTITWPTHSYNATESYVFGSDGTIVYAANGSGGSTATPTQASSPLDDYPIVVTVTKPGALGTGQFTYSLDGGTDTSSSILTPAGGVYAVPNSGVVLTLTGTLVLGDSWTAQAAAATFVSSDLATCTTALSTTYLGTANWSLIHVQRFATSSALAVTEVASLQTFALAMKAQGVYVRALGSFPTVGSINVAAGTVTIDVADTDSVVETAVQSAVDEHVAMAGGDCAIALPNSGLTLRRSAGLVAIARACQYEASRNIGDVSAGGVTGVTHLYRDENATPGFDAARIITLRTFPNYPGLYLTDGHTLALPTSDYAPLANARVVDEACTIARAQAMPIVQSKIATSPKIPGAISAKAAQKIDGRMNDALSAGMVDTSPQDAVGAKATTNRTHNILSDGNVIISVGVEPFAYGKTITVNIALQATL